MSNGKNTSSKEIELAVAGYILRRYPYLRVYRQIEIGKSIIGKSRHVDLLVVDEFQQAAAIEVKSQSTKGTTDEKIHYALADCESMRMPAIVAYMGEGWSTGVRHLLEVSQYAAYCKYDPSKNFVEESAELDAFLAATFKLWDSFLAFKKREQLTPSLCATPSDSRGTR